MDTHAHTRKGIHNQLCTSHFHSSASATHMAQSPQQEALTAGVGGCPPCWLSFLLLGGWASTLLHLAAEERPGTG